MTSRAGPSPSRGFEKIDRLKDEGFEVVDVDSDDTFVGVRLVRGSEQRTVLLSHGDFVSLFPTLRARPHLF